MESIIFPSSFFHDMFVQYDMESWTLFCHCSCKLERRENFFFKKIKKRELDNEDTFYNIYIYIYIKLEERRLNPKVPCIILQCIMGSRPNTLSFLCFNVIVLHYHAYYYTCIYVSLNFLRILYH